MTDALFQTPVVGCVPPCTPTAGATLPLQTPGGGSGDAGPGGGDVAGPTAALSGPATPTANHIATETPVGTHALGVPAGAPSGPAAESVPGKPPTAAGLVLEIHVVGIPAPQGSKRHIGNGVMIESSSKRLKPWRQDVKQAALDALELATFAGDWTAPLGDCDIDVTFLMPRPRAHYRTGRYADQLRPDAPTRHTSRPDGDKLLRGTLDALKVAQVYIDDANVVGCAYRKHYTSGHTGAVIRIYTGARHD